MNWGVGYIYEFSIHVVYCCVVTEEFTSMTCVEPEVETVNGYLKKGNIGMCVTLVLSAPCSTSLATRTCVLVSVLLDWLGSSVLLCVYSGVHIYDVRSLKKRSTHLLLPAQFSLRL